MINEYKSLRSEIEVRLWRETIYRAIQGFIGNPLILADHIHENDLVIAKIGKHLKEKYGSAWEADYASK